MSVRSGIKTDNKEMTITLEREATDQSQIEDSGTSSECQNQDNKLITKEVKIALKREATDKPSPSPYEHDAVGSKNRTRRNYGLDPIRAENY